MSECISSLFLCDVCMQIPSASRCGPCRASKPDLERLAKDAPIPFAIVYEDDLGDYLQTFNIRAFPTYLCFVGGKEVQRVEGVNLAGVQSMVSDHAKHASSMPTEGGAALGGSGAGAVSPEEARRIRLEKLGAASPAPAPAPAIDTSKKEETAAPMDTEEEGKKDDQDSKMEDATEATPKKHPTEGLDPEAVKTLTEQMGFPLIRAQKGLLYSNLHTVESAVEWLMEHQDDVDIDEEIPMERAQSYKCNECGKILSNMANLELHANKTGHSDFEESTEAVKPLTAEEKAAKIAEIKELLKAKRAEREEAEKVDNVAREKSRRLMGKEMAKTREEMEVEQRKREALARKREKEAFKKERARIRAELEKDKRERMANKGKLSSKLGVDGYNPDGIQYDLDAEASEEPAAQKPKKSHASVAKIDDYITKVSSYRAGGDGGKALKVLKAYVGNVADNPGEEKFKTINMDNKAFKTKIKPFIGAKQLLLAVGFAPKEGDTTLLVLAEDADHQVLVETKAKLETALANF